jgi:hypothetical protein
MKTTSIAEIRNLVSEALPGDNAQKLTNAIVRATELAEDEAADRLATKADIAVAVADLKTSIAVAVADLKTDLKTDIANLGTSVAKSHLGMIQWFVGTGLVVAGLVAGMIYFGASNLIAHLKP